MHRITRSKLDDRTSRAAAAIGLPLADLWLQRSETGYGVFRTFGAGAQALAECLTAAEADQFLRGLEVGAVMAGRPLDLIASILSAEQSADTFDELEDIILSTGRTVSDI
jgi:hypothetical protein